MSEWWTYSLSDFLLFSPRTYYRLFELYNVAIWPLQIVGLALGVAIVGLLLRDVAWRGRAIAAALAACWLWVAWAYFQKRYETINWAAGTSPSDLRSRRSCWSGAGLFSTGSASGRARIWPAWRRFASFCLRFSYTP